MHTSKYRKIFSAHNEQGSMKRGESPLVPRKTIKFFDFDNFRSESFSMRTSKGKTPASELVLLRVGLPSKITLQGGSGNRTLWRWTLWRWTLWRWTLWRWTLWRQSPNRWTLWRQYLTM